MSKKDEKKYEFGGLKKRSLKEEISSESTENSLYAKYNEGGAPKVEKAEKGTEKAEKGGEKAEKAEAKAEGIPSTPSTY